MAYAKKPTYSFENTSSTGINKVPQGRIVTIDDYFGSAKMFLTGDLRSLKDTTTIAEAIAQGLLTSVETQTKVEPAGLSEPGSYGFGCGIASESLASQLGFEGMAGYEDPMSKNYGNYKDTNGNIFVFIPKFYFKWDANTVHVSPTPQTGYVLHRAFINAGAEIEGFFIGKYQFGLNGTRATSVPGPVKSAQQAYLFLDQANALGDRYTLINSFMFNALAILSKAQGQSGRNAAWLDVAPKFPKGNNNSGKDINDTSVTFTGSQPAHTGSGVPFAKTTHNGQECGVADLNGNVWEYGLGLTSDGTKLYIPKESTDMTKFVSSIGTTADTAVQHFFGETAYLSNVNGFFEEFDTTGSVCEGSVDRAYSLGNGTNPVFPFSEDRTSYQYKQCCVGISLLTGSTGVEDGGTEEFGGDNLFYVIRKTNLLMPVFGGLWVDGVGSGSFAQYLGDHRTSSYLNDGSRLAVI